MGSKKRKRKEEPPTIHPKNKYSENPPDFSLLASLYPSFQPFVYYSRDGRPKIDWTDFNATRELTRILLLHDHGLNWWIPDGQLCPTVPNRSNYIRWFEDLLLSNIIPYASSAGDMVRGFDIGTGANCIYPLLGASLLGWSFVGSDVTDVALEWARKNASRNPHISEFIEIRNVESNRNALCLEGLPHEKSVYGESTIKSSGDFDVKVTPGPLAPLDLHVNMNKNYDGPPILLGVVKDDEKFDFCMCNPPFFESLEEAGLNPKTSCGGIPEEMVCPGGEMAFITHIIEDSAVLNHSFRWYTSMVGRKSNLKILISKLWEIGVTIVKTTEFVQGRTSRWGLAWSFLPLVQMKLSTSVPEKNNLSFMLEGLQRQHSAIHVLQAVESYFCSHCWSCSLNVVASKEQCDSVLKSELPLLPKAADFGPVPETCDRSLNPSSDRLCLRLTVFQQIPGTLLVKSSLQDWNSPLLGSFSLIFQKLEEALRSKFCIDKRSA